MKRIRDLVRVSYKHIVKPLAFRRDPEEVHDSVTKVGEALGRFAVTRALTRFAFSFQDPSLTQTIHGITFPNPVGLAAGFDKDGHLTDILSDVGFGWMEVGSVTGEPCAGNPKPRLWRVPEKKSLIVWYGLKNDGAKAVAERLRDTKFRIPTGISIAKTNCAETVNDDAAIADYVKAFETTKDLGAYVTVNISCPNAFGGQPFNDAARLEKLLSALEASSSTPYGLRPVFLKLSPDFTFEKLDELVEVAAHHNIQGLITSNLTKEGVKVGGLSGKSVEEKSNAQLAHLYEKFGTRFTLIGCGGIFNAEDAYKKIRLGASLLQLITGMIYEGPQLIGDINAGLVQLLKRDGFKHISEAIGVDNRA